ncbi:MAG: AraC family transcriptional regulator [Lachnospiraceae bacterium]|nr:AraC family transcriptional regulator [Lachnospiraceae bacterium]
MADQNIPAKGYLNEEFRLFHNKDYLGTDVGMHFHTFYKLTLVCYGAGTYMVDGRMYDIRSGDVILVGMDVPHQPYFAPGELYDRYTLYISQKLLHSFDLPEFCISDLFEPGSGSVIRPEETDFDRLRALVKQIEVDIISRGYGSSLAARLDVMRLLIETGRCRENPAHQVSQRRSGSNRMMDILRYINDNIKGSLTVTEIADVFYISRYHMMRVFKETFGCSVHEYILERRLTLAREMIAEGTGSTEACYACGCGSYSAFARAYRKRFGISPGKTQKALTVKADSWNFVPE